LGCLKDAELELQALSKRGWTVGATHALAHINLEDAPTMVTALSALSGNRTAKDVATGLVVAKAQLLPKIEAQNALIEQYRKHPIPSLLTALGTLEVKKT